jgi:L-methionine (R)-S-oxide reductase
MDSTTLLSELRAITTETGVQIHSLQKIANVIRNSGNYRWVGLYDVDYAAQTVAVVVYSGPGAPEFPTFPITKGLTGGTIRSRMTVSVGDVSADPRYLTAFGGTQSEIIVPIFDAKGEHVIGTIDVESEYRNAFDQDTQSMLEECAKIIAPLWHR